MIRTALRLGRAEAVAVAACGHSMLGKASLRAACQTSQRQHNADASKAKNAGNSLQLGHTAASGAIGLAVVHALHVAAIAAGSCKTVQRALCDSYVQIERAMREEFRLAQWHGGLMYAWHGTKSFEV